MDFSAPLWTGVDEIVVTGPASPEIRTVEELGGQEILVLSSSYFQSLWGLNERLGKAGKAPVKVKPAPEVLADEDILEMLNAGLIRFAVVDDHKAELWAQVLPEIRLHPELADQCERERRQSSRLASRGSASGDTTRCRPRVPAVNSNQRW